MELEKLEVIQTEQDWENALVNSATIGRHIQFYIGDLLLFGMGNNYMKRGEYDRAAKLTKLSKQTLQHYVSTSKSINSCLRKQDLDWSVQREVKALPEEKQEEFLNLAEEENLTARELRQRIRTDGNTDNTETPELPDNKYSVIYADPPWSYGNSQPSYVSDPTDYYNTMPTKDICAIPVKDIAESNAVLFLWTTSPHLRESFDVIDAWGFVYKTSFIWDKVKHNMGHYNSVRHELLLVCTKGSYTPEVKKLFDSVQSIERTGKHSEKPEEFRNIIDTLYPSGKRIELFSRTEIEKWDRYGNEIL